MIKLIATDLDGTLLTSKKEISPYTAKVLHACRAQGISIAFSTARAERSTTRFWPVFRPDICIANNGATIVWPGHSLENRHISRDTLARLMADLLAEPRITCITVETGEALLCNYMGKNWESDLAIVYSDFSALPEKPIPKISAQCEEESLLLDILAAYPDLRTHRHAGETWSQIMHKDTNKGDALLRIAAEMSILPEEIAAFGDDGNDIDMFAVCGASIAMGNASEKVKAAAKYCCGHNDEDGMGRWIAENILTAS